MEIKFCHSCAMIIDEDGYGTNEDGTKNREYCNHCYQNGVFTADIIWKN